MFKPGVSGNPKGREPGSKNKSYININAWFELLYNEVQKEMPLEQRIAYIIQASNMLLGKIQNLPGNPGDSLENAKTAFDLIKEIESHPDLPEITQTEMIPDSISQTNGNHE